MKDTLWQHQVSLNVAQKAAKKVLDQVEVGGNVDAANIAKKAKNSRAKAMALASNIDYALEFMVDKDGKELTLRTCKGFADQAQSIMKELSGLAQMLKPFVRKKVKAEGE